MGPGAGVGAAVHVMGDSNLDWGQNVKQVAAYLRVIGASEAAGLRWGPGELNPYRQFLWRKPDDIIGGSMFVYRGTFDIPRRCSAM